MTVGMLPYRNRRFASGLLLALGGISWTAGMLLIRKELPPFSYDDYNRFFTIPLVFLLLSLIGVYRTWKNTLRGFKLFLSWTALVGVFLLLAGNTVEFWINLLQPFPNARAAYGTGAEVWIGSYIGWGLFCLGMLVLLLLSVIGAVYFTVRKQFGFRELFLILLGLGVFLSVFFHDIFSLMFGMGMLAAAFRVWLKGGA